MKHGRIVEHGTYEELLARGVDFHAEVEEGQAPQLGEPAADVSDSSHSVVGQAQGSPAAAANGAVSNGVHEGQQAQQRGQASSEEQSGGQKAKEATKATPPSAELAKGDLTKVLREWPCALIASATQEPCLPVLCWRVML